MIKVYVEDFQGLWDTLEFETRQQVWDHIHNMDMVSAIEVEGLEQAGVIPTSDELTAWVDAEVKPVSKRNSPQYFVIAKSLWQGDSWSAVAGAFTDKAEAEKIADELSSDGVNSYGYQDLKAVVNTRVVSKSKMQRVYKINLDSAYNSIAWVEQCRAEQEQMKAELEAQMNQ